MKDNLREIKAVYQELKGVLDSLKDITSGSTWFYDNGFSEHVNSIINRINQLCPEVDNATSYKIIAEYNDGTSCTVNVIPTRTKITSLIGRLNGLYSIEEPSKEIGPTFIQNQNQSQHQTMSLVLNIQERILSQIQNYDEGTPERSFLEKLKSKLPGVSDVLSIISSILTIGNETGVNIETIKKLLGL